MDCSSATDIVASCSDSEDDQLWMDGIKHSGARFVAEMRSNSSITTTACEKAVSACNDITQNVVDGLKHNVEKFLRKNSPECDPQNLLSCFDTVARPLDFLATDYKQREYFGKQNCFVKPVELGFGAPRHESKFMPDGTVKTCVVYDRWQYIPLLDLLQVILSQPGLVQLLKQRPRTDGLIEDFVDGENYWKNPLFSDDSKLNVAIELYYDDLETANPLGSKATIHKIGVFYVVLKNLPACFTSCMGNIHLLALAHTSDLTRYGYNVVLERITKDIRILESEGVEINVSDKLICVFGTLSSVTGDNLGRHSLFGFFESFRAHRFCETCMAHQDDIQQKFEVYCSKCCKCINLLF